jgi:hypothetical protein
MRALFTAWVAIASTYSSDNPLGAADRSTVHSGRTEL